VAGAVTTKYRNIAMPNLRLDHEEITAVLSYLDGQRSRASGRDQQGSGSAR